MPLDEKCQKQSLIGSYSQKKEIKYLSLDFFLTHTSLKHYFSEFVVHNFVTHKNLISTFFLRFSNMILAQNVKLHLHFAFI